MTPERAQRRNRLNTLFHLPKCAGTSRHGDPVRIRQSTASRNCRLFAAVTPGSVSTVLSGFVGHSAHLACAAVLAVVDAKMASVRTNCNPMVNRSQYTEYDKNTNLAAKNTYKMHTLCYLYGVNAEIWRWK